MTERGYAEREYGDEEWYVRRILLRRQMSHQGYTTPNTRHSVLSLHYNTRTPPHHHTMAPGHHDTTTPSHEHHLNHPKEVGEGADDACMGCLLIMRSVRWITLSIVMVVLLLHLNAKLSRSLINEKCLVWERESPGAGMCKNGCPHI